MKKIRKEIAFFYDELEEIVNEKQFKKEFGGFDRNESNSLKTNPKGYEKDHPAIEFLKLKCFTASQKIDDKQLSSKNFVSEIADKLIVLKPMNDFLNRALETNEE